MSGVEYFINKFFIRLIILIASLVQEMTLDMKTPCADCYLRKDIIGI